jgi:hypothetical protein
LEIHGIFSSEPPTKLYPGSTGGPKAVSSLLELLHVEKRWIITIIF